MITTTSPLSNRPHHTVPESSGESPDEIAASLQPNGLSPRQRSRLIRTIQYVVIVAIVVVIIVLTNWHTIYEQMFYWPVVKQMWYTPGKGGFEEHYILLSAFLHTLLYTVCAFILGLAGGFVLSLMKISQVGPYRWLATIYIEFFRGVPALLVIMTIGLGVPLAFHFSFKYVTLEIAIALGIVSAAYLAETMRAGLQAVPRGQIEAARSLGMTHMQSLTQVVIPQAFRIVLPPLTNELIALTKDTSLVYLLPIMPVQFELAHVGSNELSMAVGGGITSLFAVGFCYLIITVPLGFVARRMEKQNRKGA